MRKKLVVSTVLIAGALLLLGSAYALGYQVYQSHNTMSASTTLSVSPELSTLHFSSASGELLAEFNYSAVRLLTANSTSTATAAAFGFQVWHAPGFSVQTLNITFSIGPYPAKVWVSQLSYDTGSHPQLDMRNLNYTGDPSEVSGAVLTLSGFPSSGNPSTLYSVGLSYGSAATPETVGSTGVLVRMSPASGSGVPYVGETYSGSSGFNLVAEQSILTTSQSTSPSTGSGMPTNFAFGSLPYLTVTPANSTFSIPLYVGAHIPATISYNTTGSYAISFSNGTEWVYSSTCNAGINGTSMGGWPTGTDICSFAADNYLPENGQIVNPSVDLVSSGTLGAVSPASVSAGFDGSVTLTLHIGLPPGVYSLYLVIDVVTGGVGSGPWNLSPLPLVVLKA